MKSSLSNQASVTMAPPKGFVLTAGDVEILRLVYGYRLLTVDNLMALTGRTYVPVHRRVSRLVEQSYLYRIVRPMQKHLFAIGKAGIAELVQRGLAPEDLLDWRPRHGELKPLFIDHQLMVVDLHCILELATRGSEIRVMKWQEGPSIFDGVVVTENGARRKLAVRPDALFVLEDTRRPAGGNRATFLLEADRSTCSHKRFCEKLRAYWEYFRKGLHTRRFGVKKFRVVTVTLTRERALNLCETAVKVLPEGAARQMFLFTSIEKFSLESPGAILGEIFVRPHDFGAGVRHQLIPPVKPVELIEHD